MNPTVFFWLTQREHGLVSGIEERADGTQRLVTVMRNSTYVGSWYATPNSIGMSLQERALNGGAK